MVEQLDKNIKKAITNIDNFFILLPPDLSIFDSVEYFDRSGQPLLHRSIFIKRCWNYFTLESGYRSTHIVLYISEFV